MTSWMKTGRFLAAAVLVSGTAALAVPSWAEPAVVTIGPGENAQDQLLEALIMAEPGQTIRLAAGTYPMTEGLSLDVDGVTVEGAGMNQTILSFKGQEAGGEGLLVTSDNVTLRGFAVEDAAGDAIKSKGADNISFINVRAQWTNGPDPENGAYGLYPVESTNVLIDGCVAIGASDAGIYVGQSENIIVRNSRAEFNVAGIEIENSYHADVYNNIATNNTGGLLIFDLPGLPQAGGHTVRAFNNVLVGNNTENFAPEGNIVAGVPAGTGVIVMANRNVHIFQNVIGDNNTTNILVSSYNRAENAAHDAAEQAAAQTESSDFVPVARDVFIYRNALGEAGGSPDGNLAAFQEAFDGTLPSIIWDGVTRFMRDGEMQEVDVNLVIKNNAGNTSFADLGFGSTEAARTTPDISTDLSAHAGDVPSSEDVTLGHESGSSTSEAPSKPAASSEPATPSQPE